MGLQEDLYSGSFVYLQGCYKIYQYNQQIKIIIDNFFNKVYINPINDWDTIEYIFNSFGKRSCQIDTGLSKFYQDGVGQGDGRKNLYTLDRSFGTGLFIYNLSKKFNLLKDDCEYNLNKIIDNDVAKGFNFWSAILKQYEYIKQLDDSIINIAYSIAPLKNWLGFLRKSPGQYFMYKNNVSPDGFVCEYNEFTNSNISAIDWNIVEILSGEIGQCISNESWKDLKFKTLEIPIIEEKIIFDEDITDPDYLYTVSRKPYSEQESDKKICFGENYGNSYTIEVSNTNNISIGDYIEGDIRGKIVYIDNNKLYLNAGQCDKDKKDGIFINSFTNEEFNYSNLTYLCEECPLNEKLNGFDPTINDNCNTIEFVSESKIKIRYKIYKME